ncbi:transposase, partial [Acinetobacter baumannii]
MGIVSQNIDSPTNPVRFNVSASLISKVTDAVIEQVTEWQNRALDSLYPVVYLDC